MTGNTKMVRDALGSPVPQTFNSDGTYSVLASGNTNGIDFSKHKMLRDALGSPLPYQYFDVAENKFVAGSIGGGGSGGAVDSVNGKTGIVNLIASDVGAASEADLTNLTQTVTQNAEVVTQHLDEIETTPTFNTIPLDSSQFSGGEVLYRKGANNLTELQVSSVKITDFPKDTIVALGYLPDGYKPERDLSLIVSMPNSDGQHLGTGLLVDMTDGAVVVISHILGAKITHNTVISYYAKEVTI